MNETPDRDTRIEYRGTGFYVGLVVVLLLAVVLLILAVQNTQDVTVSFLGFEFTVPLFAVAIGAVLLAVILDELVGLVWRKQRRIRLEERAELERLRADRKEASVAEPAGSQAPPETTVAKPPATETDGEQEKPSQDSSEDEPGGTPPTDLRT